MATINPVGFHEQTDVAGLIFRESLRRTASLTAERGLCRQAVAMPANRKIVLNMPEVLGIEGEAGTRPQVTMENTK